MKKVKLGSQGAVVSRVGLGCMGMSQFYGERDFLKNQKLVANVRAIAEQKRVETAQLALAWILAKGEDIVPIPGTKRRKCLEANAAAADIHLTPAEIAELEKAVPKNAVAGERYSAEMMQAIDR